MSISDVIVSDVNQWCQSVMSLLVMSLLRFVTMIFNGVLTMSTTDIPVFVSHWSTLVLWQLHSLSTAQGSSLRQSQNVYSYKMIDMWSRHNPDPPAVSFIFMSTKAPIWLGEYIFPSWAAFTHASPLEALTISNGTIALGREDKMHKQANKQKFLPFSV